MDVRTDEAATCISEDVLLVDSGRQAPPGPADEAQGVRVSPMRDFFLNPRKLALVVPPGCYYAWIFLVCFTPLMFEDGAASANLYAAQLITSLAGYLVVLLYRLFGAGFRIPIAPSRVLAWSAAAVVGTAVVETAWIMADPAAILPVVVVASFLAGAAFALVHVYWIAQYASSEAADAPYVVGGFLALSLLVTLATLLLPRYAAFAVIALLPLAAGMMVDRIARVPGGDEREAGFVRPAQEHGFQLPQGFLFGLLAMGLVYGLAQDFALAYWHENSLVAIDCIAANGAVGLLVMLYAWRSGKNFGYSAWCLVIVPLAGFAQGMIAIYRAEALPVSLLFMRMAFVLFDAMVWLQLPRAFQKVHSIRVYLLVRLAFEGSLLAGIVLHKVLQEAGFVLFNPVALAGLTLLLAALTFAFASDNVGTVWNLIPQSTQYTGKFRRACHSIEEEYGLTKRESEVLELVLRGRSGPYIEEKLFISKNTFQTHMRNIYTKMDIHSQQDLLDLLEQRLDERKAQEGR